MTRVVHKFKLDVGVNRLTLGADPEVRLVSEQGVALLPTIWIEHEPVARDLAGEVVFIVIGTGDPVPQATEHVGSAVCSEFVWHVYQAASTTRDEHLQWAKDRAVALLPDRTNAIASMLSDLSKHADLEPSARMGAMLVMAVGDNESDVRRWIEGFN